jgi:hypothetical protein
MGMVSCGKGHFYNDEENTSCPFCGVQVDIGGTKPLGGTTPDGDRTGPRGEKRGETQAHDARRPPGSRDSGETRHIWAEKLGGLDPVVGWLVCIEGPDRGRDYRIHTGRNFIGRSAAMDIAISGDASISRENHAEVIYDPKHRDFSLEKGQTREMVYLNDERVSGETPLAPYDQIELGASKLLFVPFCGERFTWKREEP